MMGAHAPRDFRHRSLDDVAQQAVSTQRARRVRAQLRLAPGTSCRSLGQSYYYSEPASLTAAGSPQCRRFTVDSVNRFGSQAGPRREAWPLRRARLLWHSQEWRVSRDRVCPKLSV